MTTKTPAEQLEQAQNDAHNWYTDWAPTQAEALKWYRRANNAQSKLVSTLTRLQEVEAENERLRLVYKHARGICFGADWNKGTQAGHHRQKLIAAVNVIEPLPFLESKQEGGV